MTEVNTQYAEFSNMLWQPGKRIIWKKVNTGKLKEKLKVFKMNVKELLELSWPCC